MRKIIPFLFLVLTVSCYGSVPFKHKLIKVFDEVIWGFDFISETEIVMTLRSGEIFKFNLSTKKKEKVLGGPKVWSSGQGGMLDILLDKNDIYLTYSKKKPKSREVTTALFKGTFKKDRILNGRTIFEAKTKSTKGVHFGSRVVKVGEALFMSVGDRGIRDRVQELDNHHGKILRLALDGKPYPNNPIEKSPYIYIYGHRNPQGIFYDQINKNLFSSEFGPRGGDELNLIRAGKNYGWPVATYGKEYWGPSIGVKEKKGMEAPLAYWVPSISPSGLMIYQHQKFSQWKGSFFLANLGSEHLRRVKILDGKVVEEEKLLEELELRMRVVKQTPSGNILIGTDSGELILIYLPSK